MNDAACRLLGYSRLELQQMTLQDMDAPENPSLPKKIRESRHRGHVFVETALRRRDGATVPVELSSRLVEYAGLPVAFSIARDMTERKEAEEKLRQSEVLYRSIFENTGTVTCITDENTILRLVNEECIKLTGYSREELEGKKSWTEFIVPEDLERLKEYHRLRRLDAGAAPKSYTLRWQDRQGRIRYMLATVALIPGTNNSVASLVDLTAQQEAEKALQESEEKYRAIFENSGTAICIVDEDHTLSLVNSEFAKLSGYTREELEGKKSWMEFASAEDQLKMTEYHRLRRIDPHLPPRNYEARFIDRQGAVKVMLVTASMLPGTNKSVGSLVDITARKKAERELEFERKKFQTLTEDSPFALVMISKEGEFKYVNPKFIELFGYDLADVPDGRTWFRKAYPDSAYRRQVIASWVEDLKRAKPREKRPRTYTVSCKDGTEKIISFIPIQLENGDNLMTCEDVTERHLAVEAVKQSEQRFRLLMENSMVHLAIIDPQGTVLYENPTMERLLGYEIGELDGKNSFALIHPEDLPRALEVMRQLLESPGEVVAAEVRYRHQNGSWRSLEVKAKNLLDEPVIRGIVVNTQDITERKQAEEAVRQSEQRFRLLMENSMVHLAIIDARGTVIYENPSMESPLGYESGEFEGKNRLDLMHPEDLPRALEVLRQMLADPGKVFTEEVRYRHKDGSWRWLEVKGKNLLDELLIRGIVTNIQDITQRKEMLEALRQSQERYRAIVEDQTELVCRFLADGTVTFANEALCRYFAKPREEMIGSNFFPSLPDEEKAVVRNNIAALNRDHPFATHENRVFLPDGQMAWHQWTIRAIFDHQGRIIEFQGVGLDITERKRAEEALRQSEAEKSLILRNMSEKVVYYDCDNRIIWANQAMADFVGLTSEEAKGLFCYELLHQRHTPCPDCQVIKSMKAGQPLDIEVVKPDGRIILYRSSPVRAENGQLLGNVLLTRDITARKKAEEKMRLVIESSPVGIRITQKGRHIYVNPALMNMFGYGDAGEIVGLPVGLLFASDESEVPRKMPASPGVKPAPSSYEARGLKKDGARIEVQVWQTEIDYQGEPAILDFVLDISEAKDLRNQLLQAQKMEAIGTLAGGIAHDFNNILFPILVNAEMILESLAPDSFLRQRMEWVFKACERAIDLVKQILAFSRQEERELSLVHLTPIIDDSLRLLRASLPATIEMRQHLDGAADTVLADPTQIQQVLINLYTNAAHALRDRGGMIDISLRELDGGHPRGVAPPKLGTGPYLQLTVKDNGHGMDADTKERIFDPYFTTKKPGEGTGLGLAVVHGIIKRHGGAISVESELGKGSSFHIFLPRREGEVSKETREPITLPQGRERVLLVDDEAEIISTMQAMLESLGYQVTAFTSSPAALDTFRAHPEDFDLMITDQTMPHLTGEEMAREILNLRPDLPIIICTGFSETMSPEKARTMGFRDFLIKPIATRMMAETIRRALARHQDRN